MLTRLEVSGFKNLLGVTLDLGPYTCIAGPNASGKSNLFDAIEFLSLLADSTFMEAAQALRSAGRRSGDPRTLFWKGADGRTVPMELTAEMIVPSVVEDDFGRPVAPTTSFLRYSLRLAYEEPEGHLASQLGRISLVSEELRHITKGEAGSHLPWKHSKSSFRDEVVFGRRSGVAYISTTIDDDSGIVNVHQDGGSRGQPRTSPAARAPRTVVSTTTTSDDPTILAARREMQSWRTLALEPSAMRAPDALTDPSSIAANGAHLAATLNRLVAHDGDAFARVAADAAGLADVREVSVDLDPHRELLTLNARIGNSPMLPARALSDGTLRFLALCIMSADPDLGGLVCMEEPENGIHPARIEAMVDLVRSLAVDPFAAPGDDNPVRQVLVNTHSPYFVQFQNPDDLLLAIPATTRVGGSTATTLRLLPMAGTWRPPTHGVVSKQEIRDYLVNPPGTQLSLSVEGVAS